MITETKFFTTENHVEAIVIEDYKHCVNVEIDSFLGTVTIEEKLEELKETFKNQKEEQVLIAVKYVPPLKTEEMRTSVWLAHVKRYTNGWGFKIFNKRSLLLQLIYYNVETDLDDLSIENQNISKHIKA